MSDFIMIDIETLDIKHTSIVLSIGACAFDINKIETVDSLKSKSFYKQLDIFEQEKIGRTIGVGTLSWWTQQGTLLKDLFKENQYQNPVGKSLTYLNNFITFHKPEGIWSYGPSFDMNIITSLYTSFDMTFPIDFRKWYDVRTCKLIANMLNLTLHASIGTKHNALDDAMTQAMLVNHVLYNMKAPQQIASTISKTIGNKIPEQKKFVDEDYSEYDGPNIEDLDLIIDMNSN